MKAKDSKSSGRAPRGEVRNDRHTYRRRLQAIRDQDAVSFHEMKGVTPESKWEWPRQHGANQLPAA
jgi:hypothetical protein